MTHPPSFMNFELGDSVAILKRNGYLDYVPWKSGFVTSVGENCLRVRCKRRFFWDEVIWVPIISWEIRVDKLKN